MDSLGFASKIYENLSCLSVETKLFHEAKVYKFCSLSSELKIKLKDMTDDNYVNQFLTPLLKYRYNLLSAPLSPSYLGEKSELILKQFRANGNQVVQRYRDCSDIINPILFCLEELFRLKDNMMLDHIIKFNRHIKSAIVFRNSAKSLLVESYLANQNVTNLQVVSPHFFKKYNGFDKIIYVGSPRWLGESQHLLSAPKVDKVDIYCYDWLPTTLPPQQNFLKNSTLGKTQVKLKIENFGIRKNDLSLQDQHEELIEFADNEHLGHESNQTITSVSARLIYLADNFLVHVDDNPNAKSLIVADDSHDGYVHRVLNRKIEVGSYLILRTEKTGDYVVEYANSLMGAQALDLRLLQNSWKEDFKNKVVEDGFAKACAKLKSYGCDIADEINIKNWINSRSIKTQQKKHFIAILKYVGKTQDFDDFWSKMEIIVDAHRQAGQQIRKKIIGMLDNERIKKLAKLGRLDLSIDELDGGILTIFRVERIAKETFLVAPEVIGEPMKLGDL